MAIKKIKGDKARGLRGATNWKKVKPMTDADIHLAATLDPEIKEFRPDELARFKHERKKLV